MITERYIKMCREAKEIQEVWKPVLGDRVEFPDSMRSHFISSDELSVKTGNGLYSWNTVELLKGNITWRPYQDQLQDLINKALPDEYGLKLSLKFEGHSSRYACEGDDWNEYWLMRYMGDVHRKLWSDEDGWTEL